MASSSDYAQTSSAPPQSRWNRATSDAGAAGRAALGELAGSYWYCVYAWWRRAGFDAPAAAAATVASYSRWLGEAPPTKEDSGAARMREWLPARLVELAAEGVKVSGPAALEIEPVWAAQRYADEPPGEPDAIFQRRWALTVLEFATTTLQAEYAARGEDALFTELLPFAGFEPGDDDRYTSAASRTGRTSGAMRRAVFDFRTRQREVLRAYVDDTVIDPADVDSEMTALLCACEAAGVQMTPLPGVEPAAAPLPTAIRALRPDEVFARAMQSVRMTHSGAGGWHPPTVAEAARLFPQYEVLALLGRGGMGAVYQARQIELDRLVAIKLLPLEVSVDKDFADRFRREARAMAKLNHPNVIAVFDFGTTQEGHLFFVMEFVEGANLHDLIHGPGLEPPQALEIITGVCDALAYAHGKGIVHRDIKPANVMVSTESQVKVADFGLARLADSAADQLGHTVTGTVMGTPDYMAPEQKRGMNVDHRADIYSVGVMLYEALCKETPQGIFDPPSTRIGCDPRIDAIVIKAMHQSPERRYQSTQEMKIDVATARELLEKEADRTQEVAQQSPKASTKKESVQPQEKTTWLLLYLGALAALLALIGGGYYFSRSMLVRNAMTKPALESSSGVASTSSDERWNKVLDRPEAHGPKDSTVMQNGWILKRSESTTSTRFLPETMRDGGIRAKMKWAPDKLGVHLGLRAVVGESHYAVVRSSSSIRLEYVDRAASKTTVVAEYSVPAPAEGAVFALELRTVGSTLTVKLDNREIIKVEDIRILRPGTPLVMATESSALRDLEVLDLDSDGAVRDVLDSAKATLEAGAIKLWDSPEKIPKQSGVRWENGAARVDDATLMTSTESQDAFIRAEVQMSSEAKWLQIGLRRRGKAAEGMHGYALKINTSEPGIALINLATNSPQPIQQWKLPRAYREDEWARVELRAVGDLLTVTVDGQPIGSLHDSSASDSGAAFIYAKASGYFRDIVYVPLDKPSAKAPPTQTSNSGWQPLFDQAALLAGGAGWEFKNGKLHSQLGGKMLRAESTVDGAIRARLILTPNASYPAVVMRVSEIGSYSLLLGADSREVRLQFNGAGNKNDVLGSFQLPQALQAGETLSLELHAEGPRLTASIDGTPRIQASDDRLKVAGRWGPNGGDCWFESVEVQSLPAPPAGQANAVETFAGHRYQLITEATTWQQAKEKAVALGGHLATITSREEQEWIVQTFGTLIRNLPGKTQCRIGASADTNTSGWRWVTGEPFQYEAWAPDKPNYRNSNGAAMPGPYAATLTHRGGTFRPFVWTESPMNWAEPASFLVEWDDAGSATIPSKSNPVAATDDAKRRIPGFRVVLAPAGL